MKIVDERERLKRPSENDLQWRQRIEQLDQDSRDTSEPIVTAEAERHGDYRDEFVMHLETQTLARTKRNRQTSPFLDLFERGAIDQDQYGAALEIAAAAEQIMRAVSIRGSAIAARVDHSGSAHDALVEKLGAVRIEMTYTKWRNQLPMPRRMYLDMIIGRGSMFRKARQHGIGWPVARKRLINALDNWIRVRDDVARKVDEEELEAAHKRLSTGPRKGLARE